MVTLASSPNGREKNGGVPPPRVLVVEDDEDILHVIRYGLEKEGFTVVTAVTGEEGLALARESRPDVVLLDLMLPGIDGLQVCRRLRDDQETSTTPIVMLSARDAEADIVAGLELGADDYLTKPFSPRVLAAHLRAVLRRREAGEPPIDQLTVSAGGISLDRERREALVNGSKVDLTFTEFEILWLLAANPGKVFTRSRIVDAARGTEAAITERAIDVRLVRLRRKLGEAASHIETVRGVGYRFGD